MAAPAESIGPVAVEPRLGEYLLALDFALDLSLDATCAPLFNLIFVLNSQNIVLLVVLLGPWSS